jgi:hypothetical protein
MESVFNMNKIKNVSFNNSFSYSFLDVFRDKMELIPYYDLMNSYDEYKLKNIYRFLFLRSLKMHKKYPKIDKMIHIKDNISYELMDHLLKEYINDDILKGIIISNGIYNYFYPNPNPY